MAKFESNLVQDRLIDQFVRNLKKVTYAVEVNIFTQELDQIYSDVTSPLKLNNTN